LELARSLGAVPLATEAADELRAAGGRRRLPRPSTHSAALTPAEALTPTEARIARLAAQGLSSPQIAQALFVARKTVDWHLGHAFRKLGVTSRHQLAGVLTPEAAAGEAISPAAR
ncbi:MAG: helix-turn-helix domain-containing protein, partial [Acidimicrobiales bacterium]